MMGYYDCYEWLKQKRLSGSDEYYKPMQIVIDLKLDGSQSEQIVKRHCNELLRDGIVEGKLPIWPKDKSRWAVAYRFKKPKQNGNT